MSDELKPCPFCGAHAKIETLFDDFYVEIFDGRATRAIYATKQEAIEAWNKRVETSPFKKYELEFIIKVLLHDSVAKQTVDIMRVNIIRKCQKLIKDSPLGLLSVDKIALDRLLKRGENNENS